MRMHTPTSSLPVAQLPSTLTIVYQHGSRLRSMPSLSFPEQMRGIQQQLLSPD